MSDINIPGVTSKYNTTEIVKGLVEAERLRLVEMEDEVTALEANRQSWRQVNRRLGEFQRSVKLLYGFDNPFSEKTVHSSNERILSATASRAAAMDDYKVTIKQTASADRFLTPSLPKDFRIEAGIYTFQVGDESVTLRYRGGTVEDFARQLSKRGEGLLRASTVRDTADTQVLMIEAVPTGRANRLFFLEDARTLGLATGMLRQAPDPGTDIVLSADLSNASGEPPPKGALDFTDGILIIRPRRSARIPLELESNLDAGTVLEYEVRIVDTDPNTYVGPSIPRWPSVPEGRFEGLSVQSSGNAFPLPKDDATVQVKVENWKVLELEGSSRSINLPEVPRGESFQTVRIKAEELPEDPAAVIVRNDNTERDVEIRNIRFYDPGKRGGLEPTHPVSLADDAVIEFRGIEVRRPTNTIDDLIDGLTLELKRPSDEDVDLKVEPDTELAKEGIIRFVFNYNRLLSHVLVLTNDDPTVIDELEYLDDQERSSMEEQLGSMRGDLSLIQLKNRLQTIISSPHPTEKDLDLLVQIGVSTNASTGGFGGALNRSKLRGYLEIDEGKLNSYLVSDINAVKDLFGRDSSGDLIIDSGVALSLDKYIGPYVQTGGLLSNRIGQLDRQIERGEEDISDYEIHLEEYEAELRRKYGIMEGMLDQLERSSREIDNFNKRQGNN